MVIGWVEKEEFKKFDIKIVRQTNFPQTCNSGIVYRNVLKENGKSKSMPSSKVFSRFEIPTFVKNFTH